MKKVILILGIIASLTSCKKQQNFIYKYSYTTEKSAAAKRTSTSLSNYSELLTPSQIQAERLIIRQSKKDLLNEIVISDTLTLTNF